jgi:hypothetical protein
VDVESLDTGQRRRIECDTVVTTGDWIPDNELIRAAGIDLDPHTRGPRVDTALRTSVDGVFAAGNVLHPVDTADVAALSGRHVADAVRQWLDRPMPSGDSVAVGAEAPIRWIAPQLIRPGGGDPARERFVCWVDEYIRLPRIEVRQNAQVIERRRLPWPAAPGRAFRLPASLFTDVTAEGGPVSVHIVT